MDAEIRRLDRERDELMKENLRAGAEVKVKFRPEMTLFFLANCVILRGTQTP